MCPRVASTDWPEGNIMRTRNVVVCAVALLASSSVSMAYKQQTHQMLTSYAASASNSVLTGSGSVLVDLQLPALAASSNDYTSSSTGPGNALAMLAIGVYD